MAQEAVVEEPKIEREIATVDKVLCKRKFIDWKAARFSNQDIRPERLDQEGPFEYLVLWADGKETWE